MTKEELKEIRSVLLGRTVLANDGRITTLEPGFHLSAGVSDGAGAVRFFGVKKTVRVYETSLSEENTLKAAQTAMENIGRGLLLKEQPDTKACLIRSILTRPVVLVFRYEEGKPILTACTGRSPTAWLAIRRALYAFTDELPEGVRPAEEQPKPKKNKDRSKEEENRS